MRFNESGVTSTSTGIYAGLLCLYYGTEGTPINKTALLLELLDRIETLENQSLPQGETISLTHDLGIRELLVFVTGKNVLGIIHHNSYGSVEWNLHWVGYIGTYLTTILYPSKDIQVIKLGLKFESCFG